MSTRRPPIVPWKQEAVAASDAAEASKVKPKEKVKDDDLDIDALLKKSLLVIQRTIQCALIDTSTGNPARNTVMNTKDCVAMLLELKQHEKDLLDEMDDEEIEKHTG